MKKIKKLLVGAILGVLFLVAVVFSVRSFIVSKDSGEEKKNSEKIVQLKTPEKQSYGLGDDVETGNIVWKVTEAELITDYEDIDAWYKARGFLMSPEEYVFYQNNDIMFPEEVRYVHLKFSVTNNGTTPKDFAPNGLYLTSVVDKKEEKYYFSRYDGQYTSTGPDGEKVIKLDGGDCYVDEEENKVLIYSVQPKETVSVDYIGQMALDAEHEEAVIFTTPSERNHYDFYLGVCSVGTKIIPSAVPDDVIQKIHLNIAGSFCEESGSYCMLRNIQEMKSRSWTNLEFTDKIQNEYPVENIGKEVVESEEPGQQFREMYREHTDGSKTISALYLNTLVNNIQIVEWKDVPEIYNEQGNLQRMAKRYQEVYGYTEDELKVLLLDFTYSTEQFGELEYEEDKRLVNSFYNRSRLYVKNEENKLHLFGLADDWTVLSNSVNPERLGIINLEIMGVADTITAQMAYILPPKVYERYDALYFTGGKYWYCTGDNGFMTKIALR